MALVEVESDGKSDRDVDPDRTYADDTPSANRDVNEHENDRGNGAESGAGAGNPNNRRVRFATGDDPPEGSSSDRDIPLGPSSPDNHGRSQRDWEGQSRPRLILGNRYAGWGDPREKGSRTRRSYDNYEPEYRRLERESSFDRPQRMNPHIDHDARSAQRPSTGGSYDDYSYGPEHLYFERQSSSPRRAPEMFHDPRMTRRRRFSEYDDSGSHTTSRLYYMPSPRPTSYYEGANGIRDYFSDRDISDEEERYHSYEYDSDSLSSDGYDSRRSPSPPLYPPNHLVPDAPTNLDECREALGSFERYLHILNEEFTAECERLGHFQQNQSDSRRRHATALKRHQDINKSLMQEHDTLDALLKETEEEEQHEREIFESTVKRLSLDELSLEERYKKSADESQENDHTKYKWFTEKLEKLKLERTLATRSHEETAQELWEKRDDLQRQTEAVLSMIKREEEEEDERAASLERWERFQKQRKKSLLRRIRGIQGRLQSVNDDMATLRRIISIGEAATQASERQSYVPAPSPPPPYRPDVDDCQTMIEDEDSWNDDGAYPLTIREVEREGLSVSLPLNKEILVMHAENQDETPLAPEVSAWKLPRINLSDGQSSTQLLVVHASEYSIDETGIGKTTLVCPAGPRKENTDSAAQMRWLHVQQPSLRFKTLEQLVLNCPYITEDLRPVAIRALERVENKFSSISECGAYLELGSILRYIGKYKSDSAAQDHLTETKPVIFFSSPFLTLQPNASRGTSKDEYRPLTLLQSLYGYDVGSERESGQVVQKLGISRSKKDMLHISQLWCLLIGSNIVITMSEKSAVEIRGESIVIDPRTSGNREPLIIHLTDCKKRNFPVVIERDYNYVDFLKYAVVVVAGNDADASDYELLHQDDEVLMPNKWMQILENSGPQVHEFTVRNKNEEYGTYNPRNPEGPRVDYAGATDRSYSGTKPPNPSSYYNTEPDHDTRPRRRSYRPHSRNREAIVREDSLYDSPHSSSSHSDPDQDWLSERFLSRSRSRREHLGSRNHEAVARGSRKAHTTPGRSRERSLSPLRNPPFDIIPCHQSPGEISPGRSQRPTHTRASQQQTPELMEAEEAQGTMLHRPKFSQNTKILEHGGPSTGPYRYYGDEVLETGSSAHNDGSDGSQVEDDMAPRKSRDILSDYGPRVHGTEAVHLDQWPVRRLSDIEEMSTPVQSQSGSTLQRKVEGAGKGLGAERGLRDETPDATSEKAENEETPTPSKQGPQSMQLISHPTGHKTEQEQITKRQEPRTGGDPTTVHIDGSWNRYIRYLPWPPNGPGRRHLLDNSLQHVERPLRRRRPDLDLSRSDENTGISAVTTSRSRHIDTHPPYHANLLSHSGEPRILGPRYLRDNPPLYSSPALRSRSEGHSCGPMSAPSASRIENRSLRQVATRRRSLSTARSRDRARGRAPYRHSFRPHSPPGRDVPLQSRSQGRSARSARPYGEEGAESRSRVVEPTPTGQIVNEAPSTKTTPHVFELGDCSDTEEPTTDGATSNESESNDESDVPSITTWSGSKWQETRRENDLVREDVGHRPAAAIRRESENLVAPINTVSEAREHTGEGRAGYPEDEGIVPPHAPPVPGEETSQKYDDDDSVQIPGEIRWRREARFESPGEEAEVEIPGANAVPFFRWRLHNGKDERTQEEVEKSLVGILSKSNKSLSNGVVGRLYSRTFKCTVGELLERHNFLLTVPRSESVVLEPTNAPTSGNAPHNTDIDNHEDKGILASPTLGSSPGPSSAPVPPSDAPAPRPSAPDSGQRQEVQALSHDQEVMKQLFDVSKEIFRAYVPEEGSPVIHHVCVRFWGSVDCIFRQLAWEVASSGLGNDTYAVRDFDIPSPVIGETNKSSFQGKSWSSCASCKSGAHYSSATAALRHLHEQHFKCPSKPGHPYDDPCFVWLRRIWNSGYYQQQIPGTGCMGLVEQFVSRLLPISVCTKELHSLVASTQDNTSNTRPPLPANLVYAFEQIMTMFIVQSQSLSLHNKKDTLPLSIESIRFKIEELATVEEDAKRKVYDYLQDAKKDIILLKGTSRNIDSLGVEAVGSEFFIMALMVNLQNRPVSRSDSTVPNKADFIDLYQKYTSQLRFQANRRPKKRVFLDIHALEEELDALQGMVEAQNSVIHKYLKLISPGSTRTTDTTRVGLYKIERSYARKQQLALRSKKNSVKVLREKSQVLKEQVRKTIEILEEDHGKAIRVFTFVTLLFLPLSFVTSFMGMNTVDVRDTEFTQQIFWMTGLPVTVVVIALALLYAYRGEEIEDWVSSRVSKKGTRSGRGMSEGSEWQGGHAQGDTPGPAAGVNETAMIHIDSDKLMARALAQTPIRSGHYDQADVNRQSWMSDARYRLSLRQQRRRSQSGGVRRRPTADSSVAC